LIRNRVLQLLGAAGILDNASNGAPGESQSGPFLVLRGLFEVKGEVVHPMTTAKR
jgi:hypothetical protein